MAVLAVKAALALEVVALNVSRENISTAAIARSYQMDARLVFVNVASVITGTVSNVRRVSGFATMNRLALKVITGMLIRRRAFPMMMVMVPFVTTMKTLRSSCFAHRRTKQVHGVNLVPVILCRLQTQTGNIIGRSG